MWLSPVSVLLAGSGKGRAGIRVFAGMCGVGGERRAAAGAGAFPHKTSPGLDVSPTLDRVVGEAGGAGVGRRPSAVGPFRAHEEGR